jgi:hypothetical protein
LNCFDIINKARRVENYKFRYPTSSEKEQTIIKSLYNRVVADQKDTSPLLRSCCRVTFNIFNSSKYNEFGEIHLLESMLTSYPVSIVLTINPEAFPKAMHSYITRPRQEEYQRSLSSLNIIKEQSKHTLKYIFASEKYSQSDKKTSLIDFLYEMQKFIVNNGGHVIPSEDKQATIETEEIEDGLRIEDYLFCNFQELVQARRSISSEENNSGGKHLYNVELAQQLDQLIQSRYEQMAERYSILRKEKPKLSELELLTDLGNVYNIKLIGADGQPNTFGNGVLLRVEPESKTPTFFEKFSNVTFSRQAKEGYNRLNQNGTKTIAERIENILNTISAAGDIGAFIDKVSRNESLGYGWHKGEGKYLNCILFDLPQGERMVVNMLGDVIYIGNYHDDKKN